MLVLTRKLMEKLYIGPDVCITVVRLEGGQVRLGIEAPREVSVVRAELIDGKVEAAPATPEWPKIAAAPSRGPIRVRPTGTHGIDSRRREPSQ